MSTPTKPELPLKKKTAVNLNFPTDIPGKTTANIGSGKNAQESMIWYTIQWSFGIGIIFSLFAVLGYWYVPSNSQPFPIEVFKSIWNVFLPIITLALGYAFGKQNN